MDDDKENERAKNLPWQHLPIEREFHDELPPRPPSVGTREAGRYCSCLCAVTPECGAWRRAGGLCSFAKEEGKPQSPAQLAPAHMKRERAREREGGRVKGTQREEPRRGRGRGRGRRGCNVWN